MEKIEFGSIEYYALIELRDNLNKQEYNTLGLLNLDRVKFEVQQRIDHIKEMNKYKKYNFLK